MYMNLGHKLKVIARVAFWVLLALIEAAGALILVGIAAGRYEAEPVRLAAVIAAMVLGPALSWLFSVPLYALGHMMENSDIRTDIAIRGAAAQGIINTDFLQMEQPAPKSAKPAAYEPAQPSDDPVDYYAGASGDGTMY